MTTLLVASTGGHLGQLFDLASRLSERAEDRLWVTFDSEQGRTLLAEEPRVFVPYIAERDILGVTRTFRHAARIIGAQGAINRVVSTGSAIALSFLSYAALRGLETHYIESAARLGPPSLTGRLLQAIPGIRLYRQYQHAAQGRWRYGGSVFDGYEPAAPEPRPVRRIVVTVGTDRGFRRLLDRLVRVLPRDAEVLWQVGPTPTFGLPITPRPFVPALELDRAMREADVVVAHAGCGSALAAVKAGRCPVLVPRDPKHGEVVDSHQNEIASWLERRGLALQRSVEELSAADLEAAAARHVLRLSYPPPFRLAVHQ
jgi:UDP-N-acetylglucosamine--N-acetylmuramyl-(pentapeptide) pyrophosphoryl-undecaprenol N-acetylglucosamine transferase